MRDKGHVLYIGRFETLLPNKARRAAPHAGEVRVRLAHNFSETERPFNPEGAAEDECLLQFSEGAVQVKASSIRAVLPVGCFEVVGDLQILSLVLATKRTVPLKAIAVDREHA
eukprot:Amastigsp_a508997_283.p1 type:complete len:113 gc:universal Amastigsp_a508997_283:857-519(-)